MKKFTGHTSSRRFAIASAAGLLLVLVSAGCRPKIYGVTTDAIVPTLTFSSSSSSGAESVASTTLAITLSEATTVAVTADYKVTGTATGSGTDYTLANGTLTFAPGETTKSITLTIIDDSLNENNETAIITLSNLVNGAEGSKLIHTYTILDNDTPPTLTLTAGATSSGSEATTPALIAVSLSAASDRTITVDYAATGGTATGGGTDYTLSSGTLTFSPGETSKNISVTIVDDTTVEATDETIAITLSNITNATAGANTSHTYTITGNDWAWNVDSAGNYATVGNWSPASLPTGIGSTIHFGSGITANRAISVDSSPTLANILFNNTANGFTYNLGESGGNFITMDNTGSSNASIRHTTTTATNQTIRIALTLNDNLDVEITSGNGLNIGAGLGTVGGLTSGSGVTLTKTGGGTLMFQGNNASFAGTIYHREGLLNAYNNGNSLGTGLVRYENSASSSINFNTFAAPATFANNFELIDIAANAFYFNTNSTSNARLTGQFTTSATLIRSILFGGSTTTGNDAGIVLAGNNSALTMSGATGYFGSVAGGPIRVESANALGTGNTLPVMIGITNPATNYTCNTGLLTEATGVTIASSIMINHPATGNANSNGISYVGSNNTTGTNSFTGPISLNYGISNNTKTLNLQAAGTSVVTFSGVIAPQGINPTAATITKVGTGTVKLTAANTYPGTTLISAGTLEAANTTGSATGTGAVTVAAGGTLSGAGIITGAVTVADNSTAILAPANAGSTALRLNGGLTLNNSSKLNFTLGTNSDAVDITGNLTLDGTIDLTAGAGLATGSYTIFTYSGALTNNTLTVSTNPAGFNTISVDTGTAGQIKINVAP